MSNTFSSFDLAPEIQKSINDQKITKPSSVQKAAIPKVLSNHDLMVSAPTGTGKTLAYIAPILQKLLNTNIVNNHPKILILAPTRELACQVHSRCQAYGKFLPFKSVVVYGGMKITSQIQRLSRRSDILIATPGRLLDLLQQKALKLNNIHTLVLDEADRMLDMGFMPDIEKILAKIPNQRQTLLFSATYDDAIKKITKTILQNPETITVAKQNSTPKQLVQIAHPVNPKKKVALLTHLLDNNNWMQVLVFTKTKRGADALASTLVAHNFLADTIHGDLNQSRRNRVLAKFKQNKIQILVATDVAARGIDIDSLACVINYDMPQAAEDYVHRIGRTGRAGNKGLAISLLMNADKKILVQIEKYLSTKIKIETIEKFKPEPEKNKKKKPFKNYKKARPKSKKNKAIA